MYLDESVERYVLYVLKMRRELDGFMAEFGGYNSEYEAAVQNYYYQMLDEDVYEDALCERLSVYAASTEKELES